MNCPELSRSRQCFFPIASRLFYDGVDDDDDDGDDVTSGSGHYIWDCRPFSVLKTLTGSRAEKSLRKNWGLLVVQGENVNQPVISHHQTISPPRKRLAASQLATKQHFPVLKMLQTIVLGYELGNNPGLWKVRSPFNVF